MKISIHAPREGSDGHLRGIDGFEHEISIHAPREGSDHQTGPGHLLHFDFNPRSPRGERRHGGRTYRPDAGISIHAPREGSDLCVAFLTRPNGIFQSTLPARGATAFWKPAPVSTSFQSTLPARGATFGSVDKEWQKIAFQSTLPARGATQGLPSRRLQIRISIHAPREGSDSLQSFGFRFFSQFQSTLPARGATWRFHDYLTMV